jgi:hypothetical protein
VVVPQVDLHQDGIYCGLAMENQDFTTKIPELSTKTEINSSIFIFEPHKLPITYNF